MLSLAAANSKDDHGTVMIPPSTGFILNAGTGQIVPQQGREGLVQRSENAARLPHWIRRLWKIQEWLTAEHIEMGNFCNVDERPKLWLPALQKSVAVLSPATISPPAFNRTSPLTFPKL